MTSISGYVVRIGALLFALQTKRTNKKHLRLPAAKTNNQSMEALITQVLRQVPSDVTREHAVSALRKHNNDVQNAVLDLLGPSLRVAGGQKQKSLTEHEEHWHKMREICNDLEKSMYAAATSASASANAKTT